MVLISLGGVVENKLFGEGGSEFVLHIWNNSIRQDIDPPYRGDLFQERNGEVDASRVRYDRCGVIKLS